ncbi:MAG: hypothetical protein AAGL69_10435 [Pseudomonadota bacterium]
MTIKTITRAMTACLSLTITAGLALGVSMEASAGDAKKHKKQRVFTEYLRPSTGFNSDCNRPVFDLPAPLPAGLHFDFIGLHDPSVSPGMPDNDALPLSAVDCESDANREVATTTNVEFRTVNGFPDVDSRLKNRRSNEVPTAALLDGTRAALPPEGALGAPFPPTLSQPAGPMSLGEFRNVSGEMKLRCRKDGTAKVRLIVDGYRPNALITVWAVWFATPPGAPGPQIVPLPFGGVPNAVPINRHGRGVFVRELGYCPMDVQENGDRLLVLDLAEHWDGATYGALPEEPFTLFNFLENPQDPTSVFTSHIGGTVTLNRGVFPMALD